MLQFQLTKEKNWKKNWLNQWNLPENKKNMVEHVTVVLIINSVLKTRLTMNGPWQWERSRFMSTNILILIFLIGPWVLEHLLLLTPVSVDLLGNNVRKLCKQFGTTGNLKKNLNQSDFSFAKIRKYMKESVWIKRIIMEWKIIDE